MTVACLRYLAAGLVALAVAAAPGAGSSCRAPDFGRQLVRTALLMGAMTALIAALGLVPMARAAGGFLVAPVVSGLLGILVWGEAATAPRLAGGAVSFVGAALLLRPEGGVEPGTLYALLGGVLLGTYLAAQRARPRRHRRALDPRRPVPPRRGPPRALRAGARPSRPDAGPARRRPRPRPRLGGLPRPDRPRLPPGRCGRPRALPLLQPARRDGRGLAVVRRDPVDLHPRGPRRHRRRSACWRCCPPDRPFPSAARSDKRRAPVLHPWRKAGA